MLAGDSMLDCTRTPLSWTCRCCSQCRRLRRKRKLHVEMVLILLELDACEEAGKSGQGSFQIPCRRHKRYDLMHVIHIVKPQFWSDATKGAPLLCFSTFVKFV